MYFGSEVQIDLMKSFIKDQLVSVLDFNHVWTCWNIMKLQN